MPICLAFSLFFFFFAGLNELVIAIAQRLRSREEALLKLYLIGSMSNRSVGWGQRATKYGI